MIEMFFYGVILGFLVALAECACGFLTFVFLKDSK